MTLRALLALTGVAALATPSAAGAVPRTLAGRDAATHIDLSDVEAFNMAHGDVDGDGRTDIVTVGYVRPRGLGSSSLLVQLFLAAQPNPAPPTVVVKWEMGLVDRLPVKIQTMDFNADGRDDVLLLWPGVGSFQTAIVLSEPRLLAAGMRDLSETGHIVLRSETLKETVHFERVTVLDYNGDSFPDMVLTAAKRLAVILAGPTRSPGTLVVEDVADVAVRLKDDADFQVVRFGEPAVPVLLLRDADHDRKTGRVAFFRAPSSGAYDDFFGGHEPYLTLNGPSEGSRFGSATDVQYGGRFLVELAPKGKGTRDVVHVFTVDQLLPKTNTESAIEPALKVASSQEVEGVDYIPDLDGDDRADLLWAGKRKGALMLAPGSGLAGGRVDLEAIRSTEFTSSGADVLREDVRATVLSGDVNGDGQQDLVVSAGDATLRGAGSGEKDLKKAGRVWVIFGGRELPPVFDFDKDSDLTISGIDKNEGFGRSLEIADFSGDGVDDIAVARPYSHRSTFSRGRSGSVCIFRFSRGAPESGERLTD